MGWESTQPSMLRRMGEVDNRAAWRDFDHQYGYLIISYCRSCGFQATDAEDIRQIVMINLVGCMASFQYKPSRGRFRDYLRTVTRHAISRYVKQRLDRAILFDNSLLDTLDNQESLLDTQWERAWVRHHYRHALDELRRVCTPKTLDVFDRLVAGDPVKHVALMFSMSADAVRRVQQRIRDRLRLIIAVQIQLEDTANTHDKI